MNRIVTFSGAGLSKESGIPTFRDSKDGLWHNFRVEDVATREAWLRNPELVLQFYETRWHNVQSCEPNAAHRAIAGLDRSYEVINITQNVDDLLERAGAKQVIHLHGSLNARKCEWHHSIVGINGDSEFHCDYRASQTAPVKLGELCPKCGGQLRPDVVWFGEAVDMQWNYFQTLAGQTDVFIGVGTSGQVEPAASLLSVFRKAKKKYFIDPEPPSDLSGYERLKGTACTQMPELAHRLIERLSEADESAL
jgi:NAD-dependent deacetylase